MSQDSGGDGDAGDLRADTVDNGSLGDHGWQHINVDWSVPVAAITPMRN